MSTAQFDHLHHVCIVVPDLDAAAEYYTSIGIGPWHDYPPLVEFTDLEVPNPEAFARLKYKWVDLGNVQLQLCEPPELPCPQRAFLDERGPGVFHLGFERDIEDALSEAAAVGLKPLMRGQREDRSGFVYFDTVPAAAVVLMNRETQVRP